MLQIEKEKIKQLEIEISKRGATLSGVRRTASNQLVAIIKEANGETTIKEITSYTFN